MNICFLITTMIEPQKKHTGIICRMNRKKEVHYGHRAMKYMLAVKYIEWEEPKVIRGNHW